MKHKLTVHHIRARSRWGTNNPNNLIKIKERPHNQFHQVFTNDTLQEQIAQLYHISYTAISDSVKYDMLKIMEADDEYVYEKWIIKPKHYKWN